MSYALAGPKKPFRVVIDPGHGGQDQGTVYSNGRSSVIEKNITLAIAKETVAALRAKKIFATLTRTEDKNMPLNERTAFANKLGAELFISVHMNSTPTPMVADAEGTETYILNNTSDASSRRLAHFENSVLGGSQVKGFAEGADKLDVALILKDLRLDANLSESKRLACALQSHIVAATASGNGPKKSPGLKDRGVKQALFYVLLGADMPSALLETGFLTNPQDRAILLSKRGQKAIAGAIAKAVEQFKRDKDTPKAGLELARCKVY
jgi:N-acetylmuramoyl-L-alanine amidase